MSNRDKKIADLKRYALALRKTAEVVLTLVEELDSPAPTARHKKQIDRSADLTARLITGARKPTALKKPVR